MGALHRAVAQVAYRASVGARLGALRRPTPSAGLEAPAVASLGNHDLVHGRARIVRALERSCVRTLVNDALQFRGDVWIAGLDSCYNGRPDVMRTLRDVPTSSRCVMLGHEPYLATMHRQLIHIAGHTHHGQIRLRWLPLRYLPPYSRPFPEALHEVVDNGSRRWVITSGGIGSTTIPIRVGCPPEIVVLDA